MSVNDNTQSVWPISDEEAIDLYRQNGWDVHDHSDEAIHRLAGEVRMVLSAGTPEAGYRAIAWWGYHTPDVMINDVRRLRTLAGVLDEPSVQDRLRAEGSPLSLEAAEMIDRLLAENNG